MRNKEIKQDVIENYGYTKARQSMMISIEKSEAGIKKDKKIITNELNKIDEKILENGQGIDYQSQKINLTADLIVAYDKQIKFLSGIYDSFNRKMEEDKYPDKIIVENCLNKLKAKKAGYENSLRNLNKDIPPVKPMKSALDEFKAAKKSVPKPKETQKVK